MRRYKKRELAVDEVRRYLEPGPIVLISTAWRGERNVMTCGWHMIMETDPSLVGCYIWTENYSRELARKSKECVINVPTVDIAETVVRIGNTSGSEIDKFEELGLTGTPGDKVDAPLIEECHASFECKLVDASLIRKYSLFVWKVVKAHVATSPKWPRTIHYRGDGEFMIAGKTVRTYRKLFAPEML